MTNNIPTYIIVVAGGSGKRMGADKPKQFLQLIGRPLLMRTMEHLYNMDTQRNLIVVLPESHLSYWVDLCDEFDFDVPHKIVQGGEERFYSVKNALAEIKEEKALVAIHDGVRPFVSKSTVEEALKSAAAFGSGIPCIPLTDSIRKVEGENSFSRNRADYRLVQTPQCFTASILKEAYNQPFNANFTDDASVVEALGKKIHITNGNKENIKITTPHDLMLAEIMLNAE